MASTTYGLKFQFSRTQYGIQLRQASDSQVGFRFVPYSSTQIAPMIQFVNPAGTAFVKLFAARGDGATADPAYGYIINVNDGGGSSSGMMSGNGASKKTYFLNVSLNRPSAYAATGDSNDAVIKLGFNNYAINDANYQMQGYMCTLYNRSPGVLGTMYAGKAMVDTRSGSTTANAVGFYCSADVGGTTTDSIYAADMYVRRQAATNPTEEGILRLRSGVSGNTLDAAIRVKGEDSSNAGFSRLINAIGTKTLATPGSNKVTLIAFSDSDGVSRYLQVDNAGTVSASATET